MTKNEALQLFASHVDVAALKSDFPDIDWVVTELSDGQQEIIIRLQGEDPDFRPNVDLSAIDNLQMQDIPNDIKNSITLRKHKRNRRRKRLIRRDTAIFKRIAVLCSSAGISAHRCIKILQRNLPTEVNNVSD